VFYNNCVQSIYSSHPPQHVQDNSVRPLHFYDLLSLVDGKLLSHDVVSGHQSLSTFLFSKPLIVMS